MKAILMGAMILSSASAQADTYFTEKCVTDTKKNVEINYSKGSGYGSYSLDRVIIDGATYTTYSTLIVTGTGTAMVHVPEFRNGSTLQLVANGDKSSYSMENKERPMNCKRTTSKNTGGI